MKNKVLQYIDEHNIGIRRNCLYLLLVSTIITLFASFTMMTELEHNNEDYKELQRQAMIASSYYQKELINSSTRLSAAHSKNLRDALSTRLETEYAGNLEQLKTDLANYYKVDGTENKLYKAITDVSYDYIDKWYSGNINVRLAVIGKTNVYFTSDSNDPIRLQRNLLRFFNMPQGNVAVINKVTGDIRVMRPEYIVETIPDLSSVYVITPAYIYEHNDIFGQPNNNPDGTQADNSALAVIVAVQPLSAENIHRIQDFNRSLGKDHLDETSAIIAKGLVNIVTGGSVMLMLGIAYTVLRARQRKLEARNGGGSGQDRRKRE